MSKDKPKKVFRGDSLKKLPSLVDKSSSTYRHLVTSTSDIRGHWSNKAEFMLSCIGMSVGLGNLWRFPTLAYKNGGAAFFIPYIILQLIIGKPMYFMELSLGQFVGKGPTGVFALNPGAKGIGFTMISLSLALSIYYNVIMAICLYYMFASLASTLPWNYCKKEWVADNCYSRFGNGYSIPLCNEGVNGTCKCSGNVLYDFNLTSCPTVFLNTTGLTYKVANYSCDLLCATKTISSTSLYYKKTVLKYRDSLDDIGAPNLFIVLCLFLSWVLVVGCLFRGVKSSGKVVYFTATIPYIVLFVLLIRCSILPGAREGIKYFLIPDWSKLATFKVWTEAGSQMFFSLTIALGPVITLGSYNKFHNSVYRDSLVISMCDLVTSFIAGCVVFSTLGAMAHDRGVPVKDVVDKAFGLVFETYPEALSALPGRQFWSFIFFLMLFTLGIDSEFALVETGLTTLWDEAPHLQKHKILITAGTGLVLFLLALPMTTPAGMHFITLLDEYAIGNTVFIVALAELGAVAWIYGPLRFINDITWMLGAKPHFDKFWLANWVAIAPLILLILSLQRIITFKGPKFKNGELFPTWAVAIGWLITVAIFLPIPVFFFRKVYLSSAPTLLEKIKDVSKPSPNWKPQKHTHADLSTWPRCLDQARKDILPSGSIPAHEELPGATIPGKKSPAHKKPAAPSLSVTPKKEDKTEKTEKTPIAPSAVSTKKDSKLHNAEDTSKTTPNKGSSKMKVKDDSKMKLDNKKDKVPDKDIPNENKETTKADTDVLNKKKETTKAEADKKIVESKISEESNVLTSDNTAMYSAAYPSEATQLSENVYSDKPT